jgi:hypothetical protein
VAANGNHEAENFNREAAEDEDGSLSRLREQHQRSDGEEESGWHHQQSRIFHGVTVSPFRSLLPGSKWIDISASGETPNLEFRFRIQL